jgi:hypothetical protein
MPLIEEFLAGNRRKFTATFGVPNEDPDADPDTLFEDADGNEFVKTDPTTVTFYRRLLLPNAETESWDDGDDEVDHEDTGVFSIELDFDDHGPYAVGVQGTGAVQAYDEVKVEAEKQTARIA